MSDASHSHHDEGHSDGAVHVHIASLGLYITIFLALIFFTVLTVGISYIHLGKFNLAIALIVATMKAALVVIFFMHLKDDARFNALIFVGTLLFVGLFFVYVTNDTAHRGEVDVYSGAKFDPVTGKRAPGGRPNDAETTKAPSSAAGKD